MSKNSYTIVNPYIKGEFENTVKAKNSVEAAKIFYKSLSEHFNNAIPAFYFTIQKGGSDNGKYSHFKVIENKNGDDISFSLQSYEIKGGEDMKEFKNKLSEFKNKFEQYGGKKKSKAKKSKKYEDEDDLDDYDDDDDDYKRMNKYIMYDQPIYYYWYDPSIYRLNYYYVPTFYSYVTPVIQINY